MGNAVKKIYNDKYIITSFLSKNTSLIIKGIASLFIMMSHIIVDCPFLVKKRRTFGGIKAVVILFASIKSAIPTGSPLSSSGTICNSAPQQIYDRRSVICATK